MTRSTVTLPPDERSPALARRAARQALEDAGLSHLLDDVLLVVTELVTNAAVHAGTAFEVDIDTASPGVRVEVTDHSPGAFPMVRQDADEEREGGRGLFLMDAVATRWGTTHFASGKSVWFEIDRGTPSPVGAAAAPGVLGTTSPDAVVDVDWLLGLPAQLERQLPARALQNELLHRLGDALACDDLWLAAAGGSGTPWTLAAVRGIGPGPEQLDAQRRALLASGEPVLRSGRDLLITLTAHDGTIGLVGLGCGAELQPSQLAVARLAAQRLAMSLGDARAAVARTRERGSLALLAEASEMFAGQLDVQLAAALAAQLVVPRFAAWSAVCTAVDDQLRLDAVAHTDEEHVDTLRRALLEQVRGRFGESLLDRLTAQSPVFLSADALPDGLAEHVAAELLVLPLVARRRLLGALIVARPDGGTYAAQDVGVLLDLARRAALAVDNARLYQERNAIAEALQAWLLPPGLPSTPGLDVGARYVSAGKGNDVGGDFYDVFRLADGGWGVAIGDVCGKGAEAAAITGLARDVVRLLLRRGSTPAEALRELNDAILELGERGRFCTAAAATLHVDGDGLSICLSVAGHPAPVLVSSAGAELISSEGSLLGVMPHVDLSDDSLHLRPGESLVFYTDGVTERRSGSAMFGDDGLLAVLREAASASADAQAGLVERAVAAYGGEASRDDLALLVVRAPTTAST